MISTLEYQAGNSSDVFFEDAQHVLLRDNAVHLVLEPGDATRYELTIVELPAGSLTPELAKAFGVRYAKPKSIAERLDKVRSAVLKNVYRDKPAAAPAAAKKAKKVQSKKAAKAAAAS